MQCNAMQCNAMQCNAMQCMHACVYMCVYVFMYACMYVCMHVCMYVLEWSRTCICAGMPDLICHDLPLGSPMPFLCAAFVSVFVRCFVIRFVRSELSINPLSPSQRSGLFEPPGPTFPTTADPNQLLRAGLIRPTSSDPVDLTRTDPTLADPTRADSTRLS